MSKSSYRKQKQNNQGFFKNPFFYFQLVAIFLFFMPFFAFDGLAKIDNSESGNLILSNSFFKDQNNLENSDLFFSQNSKLSKETPDLKIIQDSFVYGISTPRILTSQTLGDIFGDSQSTKKEITNYVVGPGDTVGSIAKAFSVSMNTIIWANDGISKNSVLKVGQTLTILPVDGILHIVKSGDTVSEIGRKYKVKIDDIVAINNLASEEDIFVGDILIIPGATIPKSASVSNGRVPLPDSFFIYPAEGIITQGLHYFNAIDLANKCSTPIYAAASGIIQRVRYGWNAGGGNYITILHSNGVVSYYGHVEVSFVKSGDQVSVGERIALMGKTGKATGCHVHFEVIGAQNPLARYSLDSTLKYKQ